MVVSLNSRLESNKEEEEEDLQRKQIQVQSRVPPEATHGTILKQVFLDGVW